MNRQFLTIYGLLLVFMLLVSACTSTQAGTPGPQEPLETMEEKAPDDAQEAAAESTPEEEALEPAAVPGTADEMEPSDQPQTEGVKELPVFDDPADNTPPPGAEGEFKTDFSLHSVSYQDILSGGPPKDGIPSIDDPKFVSVGEAGEWLQNVEPVIYVEINGDARAYPIQVLMWHEIVNDEVGGEPVSVTFCPLCNTAIAFERTVNGQVLDFGTTGRLRYSNLIMYDRQTETWWQQGPGEAIAGEMTGTELVKVPAVIIAWEDFMHNYPDGKVLSRETGFVRDYGRNPYAGYDDVNQSPFLYRGPETPGVLLPMARILGIEIGGEVVAYPYDVLQEEGVINDTVGGTEIAVLWSAGTASALDAGVVAGGRDVGAGNAFLRELDGRLLSFESDGERILDTETGSEWDVLGNAVSGDLEGERLTPVVAVNHFWFDWAVFKPETEVYVQ